MQKFASAVKKFVTEEDAPTMVEYGLMVALIAIVCLAAVAIIGTKLNLVFSNVGLSL